VVPPLAPWGPLVPQLVQASIADDQAHPAGSHRNAGTCDRVEKARRDTENYITLSTGATPYSVAPTPSMVPENR